MVKGPLRAVPSSIHPLRAGLTTAGNLEVGDQIANVGKIAAVRVVSEVFVLIRIRNKAWSLVTGTTYEEVRDVAYHVAEEVVVELQ